MMARVRSVMTWRMESGEMVCVLRSESAKTGTAFCWRTHMAEAMKV